jgi:hypothetical protein
MHEQAGGTGRRRVRSPSLNKAVTMKLLLPLLLTLPLLAGCGGNDPVTDADEAASAPAIEASVNQAEKTAVQAQLNATGNAADPDAQEQVAENLMADPGPGGGTGNAVAPTQPPG